jgi:uncharacterized protein YjbI with pentapeptide repeats
VDREELIRKYAGGEKDFTGGNFRSANWISKRVRGGIYREANFSDAYFDGSSFVEADLSFAKFVRVRIYESVFAKNCYMEGADFSYAVFGQVTFCNVDLSRAIFRNARLSETSFENANLSYADFRGARRFNEVSFENVIFYETIMPDGSIYTDSI